MRLFAIQVASPIETTSSVWITVVAIVTISLLFIGFLAVLGVRQSAKSRQLSHLERMKALELGQPTGSTESEIRQGKYQHNVFWICFWIGGAVPIAASSAAVTVMTKTNLEDFGIILSMWVCVAVISVAGVICATTLMICSRNTADASNRTPSGNGTTR